MRKIVCLLVALAMTAAACGSSDSGEGATSNDTTEAPSGGEGGDEATADGGTNGGSDTDVTAADDTADTIVVWVPSSLALDAFVEAAVASADADVTIVEAPATYDQTLEAAAAALDAGQLALVPATHGATLVDEGRAQFVGRAFEDEDQTIAEDQLGVWVVAPASGISSFRAQSTLSPEVQEVGEFVQAEAEAYNDSLEQTAAFNAAGEVVEAGAKRYGARVGGSVAARTVAKFAGPVAAVLDFLKTMHDFTVAATEAIEAESNARVSLYDTGMTATAMISDAKRQLCALEAPLIAGDVSPDEARELVDALQRSVSRAANVAVETALELEEAGDERGAAQILQLRERQLQGFFAKLAEIIDEIDRRGQVSLGPGVAEIVEATPENFDQLADILFPVAEGNESTHSNGQLTAISEGETDITGLGQFWWIPAQDGPHLDELLPCGDGAAGPVICGPSDQLADNYTAVIIDFGAPLTLDPGRIFQYAAVFDRDDFPDDNYIARQPYLYDTWDQSDIRYEVAINGGQASLNVTEGPNFSPVSSAARVAIRGNRLMALIPQTEIGGGPHEPAVRMRGTSFWHLGDFGEGPGNEFNIDVYPLVGEPYWLPRDIIAVEGPGALGAGSGAGGSTSIEDPAARANFDEQRSAVGTGLSMFPPAEPTVDDPAPLQSIDDCFANEYFFDNSTIQSVERDAFEYDGVSIQVRYELHDSESAAAGAAAFAGGTVTHRCRLALLNQNGVTATEVLRTVDEPGLFVDSIELGGSGEGLVTQTLSASVGATAIRITTVGPPNREIDDLIAGTIRETFRF